MEDGSVMKRHLDQIRKTLQSERHEGGEPEDLLTKPMHPMNKPCSRTMVPVSPERPDEWVVAPDLLEQQEDGVDKQIEQDAMVSSPEINRTRRLRDTRGTNSSIKATCQKRSDSNPPFQQKEEGT